MTRSQQQCSTPDQFLAFLRSQLSAQEETELQLHLDECISCRERLDQAAADLSVWREAREFFGKGALNVFSSDSGEDQEESHQGTVRIRHVIDALAPTDDPESLGRLGGYEVKGVVGAGGMGVVLKAHDRSLDRVVAIKVMSPHLAENGAARKRFAREAKAAAAVLHPNVIAIHSVASENTTPFLVMPFVRGASLQKRIDLQGSMPLKDTLRIGAQIAAGLAAAHGQGLVHRDIKPANILLEEGVERVTITDFGLARAIDDASMTRSGVIAGTPQYMSPEQTRGEAIDARSDLFSLGSVLYAMCAGHPPFRAETTYGVLHRIANDSPTPVCEVNSDIPVWLSHLIDRLMAKRPDDRFESAAQVAELLEGCLAHVQQPTAIALPAAVSAILPRHIHRPPIGKLIAAAAGALALVLLGIVIMLEFNKGTLIIESDSDNIPIRIVQGDKVVERLTVTKSGNTIRIAAGTYVVELDTELDGMVVENDQVSLKRGTTENIRIRIASRTMDPNVASDSNSSDADSSDADGPRFDNPADFMRHAAACQTRNDTPGFMACLTDEPVKQIATSYLLMSIMQLQDFQSNGTSNRPPGYNEQIAELTKILAEEIHGKDAATSAAALAIAQKEIADRAKDDFNETAEASMTSPLTRLLAIATIDRITNPRRFVARILALHEKYEDPQEKGKKENYAYTVQQEGNTAVAKETTSKIQLGLIKTSAGWRINDLWHGMEVQEEPKITVELYGGKDVLAQMNTGGPNKTKHVKLFQELNAIEGVVVNFRESGDGNEIHLAIVQDPAGSLKQESQVSGKPSARRAAILKALEPIPGVRWEEGSQASGSVTPPDSIR